MRPGNSVTDVVSEVLWRAGAEIGMVILVIEPKTLILPQPSHGILSVAH